LPVESAVATKLIAEADRGTKERLNVMGFFSKDIKTMDDLFVHTLRDIYCAEKHRAGAARDDPQSERSAAQAGFFEPTWARPSNT
jgi:hypothetical protein